MPNENTDDFTTKTRVCPSCRETINVLAVKCRYCGEDVGRPKDAARELSIHDLGGETIRHAAPSGSVMDALETYRAEEGQGEGAEEEPNTGNELPELDSKNQDLASLTFDRPGSMAYQHPKSSASDKMKLTLKVVAVLAIVILVAVEGVPRLVNYIQERNAPPPINHVNRALQIMKTGTLEEGLNAAVESVEIEDTVENRQILAEVIGVIKVRTNELLNKVPWDEANLSEAARLSFMATITWPSDESLAMLDKVVQEDVTAYCMFPVSVGEGINDQNPSSAELMLCGRGQDKEIVREGSTFAGGRFTVTSIYANNIVLEDARRNNRKITLTMPQ